MIRNERTGRSVLNAAAAVFAAISPAAAVLCGTGTALWFAAALIAAAAACAACSARRFVSAAQLPAAAMLLYAIFTFPSVQNAQGHIRLIAVLFTAAVSSAAAADWFFGGKDGISSERLMKLISIAGKLCAASMLLNAALQYLNLPYRSMAYGRNNLFGIILLGGILCGENLRSDDKGGKRKIHKGTVLQLAAIIVCRCFSAAAFGAAFLAAVFLSNKHKNKYSGVYAIALSALSTAAAAFISGGSTAALRDCLALVPRFPAGIGGGGFISGQQSYASAYYPSVGSVPLIGAAASSCGIFGIAVCIAVIARTVFIYLKKRSASSLFLMFASMSALFLPLTDNYAATVLFFGLYAYNEDYVSAKRKNRTASAYVTASAAVISLALGVLSIIGSYGACLYKKGELSSAESFLKAAATINIFDAESPSRLAMCIASRSTARADEARIWLNKAEKRCKNSAALSADYASVMAKCGNFSESALRWESTVYAAPHNSRYRLCYAKALYTEMQHEKRGSEKNKGIYEKLVRAAAAENDKETKKIINDIADKASELTREKKLVAEESGGSD